MTDQFSPEMIDNAALDALALKQDARQGQVMLAAVHAFLGRFVSYPSAHAQTAHALWIVHTHLMDRWESTPRLAFLSPEPASGKTRRRLARSALRENGFSSTVVSYVSFDARSARTPAA